MPTSAPSDLSPASAGRSDRRHPVYGVEVDHYDQVVLAKLAAGSAASGQPGPVLGYLQLMLKESAERAEEGLRAGSAAVRDQVRRDLPGMVVRALDGAIRGGGAVRVQLPRVELQVGLATYNNWGDLVYDEPRLVPTQQVLGVQLYEVRTERRSRRIGALNTFQPFLVIRVTPPAVGGPGGRR